MGLHYHTDFSFGRRGRRIRRTYTGVPAFLAILVDLFVMLTLELTIALLVFSLKLAFRVLVAVTYLLTFPFRIARWVASRFESRPAYAPAPQGAFAMKPAWDGLSDL